MKIDKNLGIYRPLLDRAKQMLKVSAQAWDITAAEMQMFERQNTSGEWTPIGEGFHVVLGKNGLAWDPELNIIAAEGTIYKKEGDLKSPAGVFGLGWSFGYASPAEAAFIKLPYKQCTETLICVDDTNSAYYNRIIDKSTAARHDWQSAEKMLREDGLYKWGIEIKYNFSFPCCSHGSCIFIHIWRGPEDGTEGCTAMSEENLNKILHWLDPVQNPIILQWVEVEE